MAGRCWLPSLLKDWCRVMSSTNRNAYTPGARNEAAGVYHIEGTGATGNPEGNGTVKPGGACDERSGTAE